MVVKRLLCLCVSSHDIPDTWINGNTLQDWGRLREYSSKTKRSGLMRYRNWREERKKERMRKKRVREWIRRIAAAIFALSTTSKACSAFRIRFRRSASKPLMATYVDIIAHAHKHTHCTYIDLSLDVFLFSFGTTTGSIGNDGKCVYFVYLVRFHSKCVYSCAKKYYVCCKRCVFLISSHLSFFLLFIVIILEMVWNGNSISHFMYVPLQDGTVFNAQA